jgi:hypothetical protein
MDEKVERLWLDTLQGMQNRAMEKFSDEDPDGRNRNWYAREIYGEQYTELKGEYQRRKMADLNK